MYDERKVLKVGSETDTPRTGDIVRLEYTVYFQGESKGASNKMQMYVIKIVLEYWPLIPHRFHTSKEFENGVFETAVGIGMIIKGSYHQVIL